MKTRKALVRFDREAHGMFSARSFEVKPANPEDDPDGGGVHVCVWLQYEENLHARVCGMQLSAEQVVELRDALIDFTRDGS